MKYYIFTKDNQLFTVGASEFPSHLTQEGLTYICESPTYDTDIVSLRDVVGIDGQPVLDLNEGPVKEAYIDEAKAALKQAQEQADKQQEALKSIVKKARQFGQDLMDEFATENILLGITQEGKTEEVLTKMSSIILSLQSGSLYVAIDQIKKFQGKDEKYLTDPRLLAFLNKIENYVGATPTQSL